MTIKEHIENLKAIASDMPSDKCSDWIESLMAGVKALEQEPCEMTAEEYRQRMIQAFHNADCDELIAVCVLPTEKEFEHLGWLLEKHYKAKPEPCEDTISRDKAIVQLSHNKTGDDDCDVLIQKDIETIKALPSVTPTEKVGQWIADVDKWGDVVTTVNGYRCDKCNAFNSDKDNYCPNCGAKMQEVQE